MPSGASEPRLATWGCNNAFAEPRLGPETSWPGGVVTLDQGPAIVTTLAPDSRCANARRRTDLGCAERIRRQISMHTPAGSDGIAVQSRFGEWLSGAATCRPRWRLQETA